MFCSPSISAGMGNNTEKEIFHLFDYLEKSNCEFNRNGSWYDPDEAVQHLKRKYHWLVKRGLINSAEQFIERAASRSSMSGQSYFVRCGDSKPIKSAEWFMQELQKFRETYD
jgi:hypothetical protein